MRLLRFPSRLRFPAPPPVPLPAVGRRRFRSRLRSRLPAPVLVLLVVVVPQGGVQAGRRRLSRARSRLPARRAGCRFLRRLVLGVGSRLFRRRLGGLVGREGEKGDKRGDREEECMMRRDRLRLGLRLV